MSQFTAVLTRSSFEEEIERYSAMQVRGEESAKLFPTVADETLDIAHWLILNVPALDWTIEVDILGRHRITIHFKGGSISVDE